jgi:hypothetical protein
MTGAVTIPSAPSLPRYTAAHIPHMFVIDEATIEAIRRTLDEGGELSAGSSCGAHCSGNKVAVLLIQGLSGQQHWLKE